MVNFYQIGKQIPEDGVYIGRSNRNFNLTGSIFANPFPMKGQSEEERTRVITEYKDWFWKQMADKQISKQDLMTLAGKKLVCYCAKLRCHGDVLKETVELLMNNEAEFNNKVKQLQDNKNKVKP
ncbi:MAG: DUF4326 domain-containing protein [Oligoflexus sp.]|nr:DUF4326 domain-containing protein [Pseudopedobacter sp.]